MDINIDLWNIQLNEVEESMTLDFQMKAIWSDNGLTFRRLWWEGEKNILLKDEMNKIWMPTLEFSNTREKRKTQFNNRSVTEIHIKEGKCGFKINRKMENFVSFSRSKRKKSPQLFAISSQLISIPR